MKFHWGGSVTIADVSLTTIERQERTCFKPSPIAFPNSHKEVGGDRKSFDSHMKEYGLERVLDVYSVKALTLCSLPPAAAVVRC